MKTNEKELFGDMVENYYNGNISDVKNTLRKLSKKNLILFTVYLRICIGSLYIDVNDTGEICLFHV